MKLLETHVSWVLLAGRHAYKIKKAVHPGFLDFTSLDARRFYCEEEIRLNRRFAPGLYLGVVAIGGSPENPVLDALPAIEYAVRMRRFPSGKTLDRLAENGKILPSHVDSLAQKIASFHDGLPPAAADSGYGTDMLEVMQAALRQLRQSGGEDVSFLEKMILEEFASCEAVFPERLEKGFVRECHGDLHLGNIALVANEPVPFDCIEFDPKLRWIDVMNEIAFPVMDLMYRGLPGLAFRLLNAYLERTGDYAGIRTFRFYLSCRAVVRAMVDAMRSDDASCRRHLAFAYGIHAKRKPFLIITHGLPGSGKTTFSQTALERFCAIRIRSDIERKRLAGLAALERSRSEPYSGIYSAKASQAVYSRLRDLSEILLNSGFPVIVDASFLDEAERSAFRKLAEDLGLPFVIASIRADYPALRNRILKRSADASEADLAVLDAKIGKDGLGPEELPMTAEFSESAGNWETLKKIIYNQ